MSKRIFPSALRAMRTVFSIYMQESWGRLPVLMCSRKQVSVKATLRSGGWNESRTVSSERNDGDEDEVMVNTRIKGHLFYIPRIVQDQQTRFDSVRPHQRWQKVVHFTFGHVSAVPPHTTHLAQRLGVICTSSPHIVSLCIRVL